jgi:N-acetylglucosaminyldiphosphoundecaprenol N-acetyl-beta-D-mannosaminyltransferase
MAKQPVSVQTGTTETTYGRSEGKQRMQSMDSMGGPNINPSDLPSYEILGVRVHHISKAQSVAVLDFMIRNGSPHQVVTVNPEFVIQALYNPAFREILNAASLSIPDGIGIVAAARLKGIRNVERVAGVDTVESLATLAAKKGYRFFLLGSAPGVAERAAAVLRRRNPGIDIGGTFSGSPCIEDQEEIVNRVKSAQPDILLVAYGSPAQEMWISRNLRHLNVPVSIGVGGTLDFIAGEIPRAPLWMRRAGFEWLFRLIVQPSRWRRMLAHPRFAFNVLKSRVREVANARTHKSKSPSGKEKQNDRPEIRGISMKGP